MAMTVLRLMQSGLPWLSMLAVSAALTYGVTMAAPVADVLPERSASDIAAVDAPVSLQGCDPASARLLLYGVSNGWLPARMAGYCGA